MTKILLTGASGFVGQHLLSFLLSQGLEVRCATRKPLLDCNAENILIPSITASTNWSHALKDVDIVIHLAAHAHIINPQEVAANPEPFIRVNSESVKHLASQAAQAGVKRFIFLSSIKVNGESSKTPFTEKSLPAPFDIYAQSKWQAEQYLQEIAAQTSLEIVILRPALIYGPAVKANFLKLLQQIHKGWPLPFANVHNKRSFISIDNLVSAVHTTLFAPNAVNQCFLLADDEFWSLPALIKELSRQLQCPARLFPIPVKMLSQLLITCNKEHLVKRLFGSLVVDNSKIKTTLNWKPLPSSDGLAKTAAWYLKTK